MQSLPYEVIFLLQAEIVLRFFIGVEVNYFPLIFFSLPFAPALQMKEGVASLSVAASETWAAHSACSFG
jgi:hypothetical protein